MIPSQTLLTTTGSIAGSAVSLASGGPLFDSAGIVPGHVLVLSGSANGCFPITQVQSPSTASISVMYDDLLPDQSTVPPRPVATAADVSLVVRTFVPQIALVSALIRQAVDVRDVAAILNPQDLRQAAALGTLQLIYAATATVNLAPAALTTRATMYERMYQRAPARREGTARPHGDGKTDCIRCPGLPRLVRHN